jgi:heme A synthase
MLLQGYGSSVTSLERELQELRRRRRARRIVVAVVCMAVLIISGVWLSSRNSTMTCAEWHAEYARTVVPGTQVNLEKVRPEGCAIPFVPGN